MSSNPLEFSEMKYQVETKPMALAFLVFHPEDMSFTSLRGVILLDGTRYYLMNGLVRSQTRGKVNMYSFDEKTGTYHFRKYNELQDRIIDATTEVTGAGDVWYLNQTPKMEGPPNIIAARKEVLPMTVRQWWESVLPYDGPPDNLVWDMNLVLLANGREGGRRGQTYREKRILWTHDDEFGYDYLRVRSTNAHTFFLESEEHGLRIMEKGLYNDLVFLPDQQLYLAGRSFIFSDLDLLKQCQELGIVGALPVETVRVPEELLMHMHLAWDQLPPEYVAKWEPRVLEILEGRG